MNFFAVIDTSAFIWDRADFEVNQYEYWDLISTKIDLLDLFQKNRVQHVLRDELIEKIWINFPYSETPESTRDYQSRIINYLSKTRFIEYIDVPIPNLDATPNQLKSHFSVEVKNEVTLLLSEMHRSEQKHTYFTFVYLWENPNGDSLQTILPTESQKEHDTILIRSSEDIEDYIDAIRPKFEHNPKHNRVKPGIYESPLSCFDGNDTSIPQKLLDSAIRIRDVFYNFDESNEVWVVFRNHLGNLYHGYDESDINKIPNEARKKLKK